jgi:hypothetical protein
MSWTADDKAGWVREKDGLQYRFNEVHKEYVQTAMREPGSMQKLTMLETQMKDAREKLSRLSSVINDSLDSLQERTGNADESAKDLERKLNRLKVDENRLLLRKATREQQVNALNNRTEQNPHTIGFLMIKPLSNPTAMIGITGALALSALIVIYLTVRKFLTDGGILTSSDIATNLNIGGRASSFANSAEDWGSNIRNRFSGLTDFSGYNGFGGVRF